MYRARTGITLIEVLVSIGLLATLLVTTLSIRNRHIRQIRRANDLEVAVSLLDNQIAIWFEKESGIPANKTGQFAETDDCFWKTTQLPVENDNPNWQAAIIRVEAISSKSRKVMASVELLESRNEEAIP